MEYTHYNTTYGKLRKTYHSDFFEGYSWFVDVYNENHLLPETEVIPINNETMKPLFTPQCPIYSPIPNNLTIN